MKRQLRDYQQKCLDKIIETFEQGNKQIVVLPTGSGKTFVFSRLIEQMKVKTLIIAHTNEIIRQIHESLNEEITFTRPQVHRWDRKILKGVVVCTFQQAVTGKTLDRFKQEDFQLLIIDECHRTACKGYRRIIQELGFDQKKLIGFTATPFRTDGQDLMEIFEKTSFELGILQLIGEGYLVDMDGYKVNTNVSLKGIKIQKGDFCPGKLEPVINVKNRNELIVEQYINLIDGKKALAFCVSIKHATDLRNEFVRRGICCEVVMGKMSPILRMDYLNRFRSGEIKVLTNCNLLTEGFDEPSVEALLMCRPTTSKTLYMQMIGRGCRTSPGKESCKVIEFTDNHFNICSLESLIDSTGKSRMMNGEPLSEYNQRIEKELAFVGTDVKVERFDIIEKDTIESHVGDKYLEFTIKEQVIHPENNKVYCILECSKCTSTFTNEKIRLRCVKECVFCKNLSEKNERLTFKRMDKFFDKSLIYSVCDCGNEKINKFTDSAGFSQLKRQTKSCGCLRKDLNHSRTDKYVGTTINKSNILEKISKNEFTCKCLDCGHIFIKGSKSLVNQRVKCPLCVNVKIHLEKTKVFQALFLISKGYTTAKVSRMTGIATSTLSDLRVERSHKIYIDEFKSMKTEDLEKHSVSWNGL